MSDLETLEKWRVQEMIDEFYAATPMGSAAYETQQKQDEIRALFVRLDEFRLAEEKAELDAFHEKQKAVGT